MSRSRPSGDGPIVLSRPVGPFAMNCWIVGSSATRECVVIDPGDEVDALLDLIDEAKLTPRLIMNTHAHIDHVAGVAEFKKRTGLPFYIHRAETFWIDALQEQARMFGFPVPEKPEVDRYLAEGDRVQVGDLTFDMVHCPGHTPGSLCYLVDGHLFAGDVLFAGSIGRTDLPGGDHEALLNAIRTKLWPLDGDIVVHSGHGPDTTIARERKHNPFVGENAAFG